MKKDAFSIMMAQGIDVFEMRQKEEAYLCSIFLDAIRKRNGQKILEIAEAVWFLNREQQNSKPKDSVRAILLMLKGFLDVTEREMTIKQIANFLEKATGKKMEATDGYSALRRICRELNFPLAESRKIRKK